MSEGSDFTSPFNENAAIPNYRAGAGVTRDVEEGQERTVTLFPSKLEREYEAEEEASNNNKGKERRSIFDVMCQLIIVGLLLAIFCGFLFESKVNYDRKSAHLFRQGKCSQDARFTSKYAVVFDAGSTGSRVHVYEFQFCGEKLLNLVDEVFEATKPGLSAFPEDPEEAVQSLVPLLRKAWRRVPRDLRRCSPIVLKATAGLRLLPSEKVANILGSVRSWLDDQPFHLPRDTSGFNSDPVSVIDGSEEAVSAWISVNFLQGHIGPEMTPKQNSSVTSVVLEMGGGSSQIVYDQRTTSSSELPGGIVDLNFFGRKFSLYQHSFLGYGLMEARKAIKTFFIGTWSVNTIDGFISSVDSKAKHFPCYATGQEEVFNDVNLLGNSAGWAACRELVKGALFSKLGNDDGKCERQPCSFNGVHQPKIPETAPIYALSYINDRAGEFGLNGATGFTLGEFRKRSEIACGGPEGKNPALCLDSVFIYSLLKDGYGISEDRTIHSGQKIKGYETGWTLGSALSVIESAPTFCS